mgnify:CR=1 FL=1
MLEYTTKYPQLVDAKVCSKTLEYYSADNKTVTHTDKWKDVYVNYFVLTAPDYLSVKHLPDKIKQRLITETTQESVIKMLKQERDDSQFQIAIKYCLDLDMLYKRNKGIFDLWPELEEYYVQPR